MCIADEAGEQAQLAGALAGAVKKVSFVPGNVYVVTSKKS
jgi:hypothetical protein